MARFNLKLDLTIPTYADIICSTSRTLCVINTISSGKEVPSSFQSGIPSLIFMLGRDFTACFAAASAYTTASMSEFDANLFAP